jgi:hypothetical protein
MSAGFAPTATEGSPDLAMSDPMQGSRLSRAELRRQREVAEAGAATAAPPTRAQLREKQQKDAKKRGPLRTLLTAWWVYPLVALVALFVYLGVRSAQPPSTPPGVEVTTPTPIP